MKNLIYQYWIPHTGKGKPNAEYEKGRPSWTDIVIKRNKEYAEKYGADHIFSEEKTQDVANAYHEVARVWLDPEFDKYDTVVFLDMDAVIHDFSVNIFDAIEDADFAGWPEFKDPRLTVSVNWRARAVSQRYKAFGAPIIEPYSVPNDIRMINTGVHFWSREARLKAREKFEHPNEWFYFKNPIFEELHNAWGHSSYCLDQPYINAMVSKYDFNVKELPMEYNWFVPQDNDKPIIGHYVQKTFPLLEKRFG